MTRIIIPSSTMMEDLFNCIELHSVKLLRRCLAVEWAWYPNHGASL